MKFRLFFSGLLSFLFTVGIYAQKGPLSADNVLKEAYRQASETNKNIVVIFHASWCGWCHKMDSAINDPLCKKIFTDNYIIKHLVVYESKGKENLENPGAMDLLAKYKGNDLGIPYWLIFDKNGKLLADSKIRTEGEGLDSGENTGCPASEKEVAYFIKVLQQTSAITPAQSQIIRKRFRENEN